MDPSAGIEAEYHHKNNKVVDTFDELIKMTCNILIVMDGKLNLESIWLDQCYTICDMDEKSMI